MHLNESTNDLRRLREELRLTQAQVARLGGTSQMSVSNIERGVYTLQSPSAQRVLRALLALQDAR